MNTTEKTIEKADTKTAVKCRFFAQYFGQEVAFIPSYPDGNDLIKAKVSNIKEIQYLELKPLSKITNEEAIEVAKIYQSNIRGLSSLGIAGVAKQEILRAGLEFCKRIDGNYWNNYANVFQMLSAFDYLRSVGYALPFMGNSVEDLITFGWVRLV